MAGRGGLFFLDALENESLSDSQVNAIWAGLSPVDQDRATDFNETGAESRPAATGSAPTASDRSGDDAYAAVTVPEPSYENAKDLGDCGGVGHREDRYSFPPFGAAVDPLIPSRHLSWDVLADGIDGATGKRYKRIYVDLRLTATYRALAPSISNVRLTVQTQRKVGNFNDKLTEARKRASRAATLGCGTATTAR